MSLEQLKAFLAKVQADTTLQEQLKAFLAKVKGDSSLQEKLMSASIAATGTNIALLALVTACGNTPSEETQSRYLDENPDAIQADKSANTPAPVIEEVGVEEPDPTIKGSFVNVTYLLDAPPITTSGDDATFNPETGGFTYYDTIKEGPYKGYKYNFECRGRIHYEQRFRSSEMRKTDMVCDTQKDSKGFPISTTVTDPSDGFLSSKTTFQF